MIYGCYAPAFATGLAFNIANFAMIAGLVVLRRGTLAHPAGVVRRDGTPWNWRVEVFGELPKISQVLAHSDEWLGLMIEARRKFIERAIAEQTPK